MSSVVVKGAGGVEWYCGLVDQTLQDWRTRAGMLVQTRFAHEFLVKFVGGKELAAMRMNNGLASGDARCMAQPGVRYIVYTQPTSAVGAVHTLNLGGSSQDRYNVRWYNPRAGGNLAIGSVAQVQGAGVRALGQPPAADTAASLGSDWVILVTRSSELHALQGGNQDASEGKATLSANIVAAIGAVCALVVVAAVAVVAKYRLAASREPQALYVSSRV